MRDILIGSDFSFGALRYILDEVREAQQHKDDRVIILTGREGAAKSTLAAWIATSLGFEDPRLIAFSAKQFLLRLRDVEDYGIAWLDEGGRGLHSRDALTRWNKKISKAFTQVRIKKLICIICIPHLQLLDLHLRARRVDYWGSVIRQGYKRGYVKWRIAGKRDRRGDEPLIPGAESEWKIDTYWEPLFAMRFPKFKENNGFIWEDYERIKRAELNDYLDLAAQEEGYKRVVPHLMRTIHYLKKEGMPTREIARITGYTQQTVSRYLRRDFPEKLTASS